MPCLHVSSVELQGKETQNQEGQDDKINPWILSVCRTFMPVIGILTCEGVSFPPPLSTE